MKIECPDCGGFGYAQCSNCNDTGINRAGAECNCSAAPCPTCSGNGEFPCPKGWYVVQTADDGAAFRRWDGLLVILSIAQESDGKNWFHLSASRPTRLPTWDEMQELKAMFLGEHAYAVMISPPKRLHVNLNPRVLHWFSCADGHPLPEFSRGLGTI